MIVGRLAALASTRAHSGPCNDSFVFPRASWFGYLSALPPHFGQPRRLPSRAALVSDDFLDLDSDSEALGTEAIRFDLEESSETNLDLRS